MDMGICGCDPSKKGNWQSKLRHSAVGKLCLLRHQIFRRKRGGWIRRPGGARNIREFEKENTKSQKRIKSHEHASLST